MLNFKLISKYRKKRKLSQEQLASLLDVSLERIFEWENGLDEPTRTQTQTIIRVLKIPKKELSSDDRNSFDDGLLSYLDESSHLQTMNVDDEIKGHLVEGETVLWHGQPDINYYFRKEDIYIMPFGGFWMIMLMIPLFSFDRFNATMMTYYLPFIAIGVYMVLGRFILGKILKPKTFYTITNKRILFFQKSSKVNQIFIALEDISSIELQKNKNDTGSIIIKTHLKNTTIFLMNFGSFQNHLALVDVNQSQLVHDLLKNQINEVKKKDNPV